MPSIYLNYQHDTACLYHRALLPSRYCAEAMSRVGVDLVLGEGFPDGHDWYTFGGIPGNVETVLQIGRLKRKGGKFLWSVDDSWLEIPDWNPAKLSEAGLSCYQIMLDIADAILVSTPALARTFAGCGKRVYTAPNLMDVSTFPAPPETLTVELPVRCVWVGGLTHKNDVAIVEPVADTLLRKLGPEKVAFVFMGMSPPGRLARDFLHRGVWHQPAVQFPLYQKTVNSIKPDVYLAPLADIPFNESKSAIRVFEGWSLLACPVASPVGEYNVVRSGVDGRYAATEEEWESALLRVVRDHEYRLDLAVAGRRRVESEFNWTNPVCRRPWLDVFADLFGVPTPSED